MPVIPEPVGSPAELPFLKWVREQLVGILKDAERKSQSDGNTNSVQNSTMSMLVERLGEVEASINAIIADASFDASQVTSGTFNDDRIPSLDASKVVSGSMSIAGITLSGHLYVPNSTIASFGGWTVAYIDGDGRLTRGASSRRFKYDIQDAPEATSYFCMPLREFKMKNGDGRDTLGYIAEELLGTDAERFVVFEMEEVLLPEDEWDDPGVPQGGYRVKLDANGDPIPLSIDFIPLILAQLAELKREQERTADRLSRIETHLGLES